MTGTGPAGEPAGESAAPTGGPAAQRSPVGGPARPVPPDTPAAAGGVLVVVGTDMHPFDRLMDWIERWYAGRVDRPAVTVQYGRSRRPLVPDATGFLGHAELERAMAAARLVVSHGGPATIAEARAAGRLPIVVPRDPAHGEHVDEHQVRYAGRLAAAGEIRLCRTAGELAAALDEGMAHPAGFQFDPVAEAERRAARTEAAARVGRIVEDLVRAAGRPPRSPR